MLTNAGTLLAARGLRYAYGTRHAVRHLDLTISRGECLGLLGLNGAGKSTTLRMLSGVLEPQAGAISIAGFDLQREPLLARQHLGYLPDVPPLYPDMRVSDYLGLCASLHRCPAPAEAIAKASRRCGLQDVGLRYISTLSKGYLQRIGIAQAIVHEPAVLILDEPTVGLDPRQLHEVRELIRDLARERAVILSTHLLPEVQQTCTRVAILHDGELVREVSLGEQATRFLLELREPVPAGEALRELAGITEAREVSAGRWELEVLHQDAAEGIAGLVVARGWGLRQLRLLEAPLEQTFLAITAGEGAPC